MEEVPAHVHSRPIVSDVLSRNTSTDPCRRFGRNLFQCYSTAPRRLVEIIDRTSCARQHWGVRDRVEDLILSLDLSVVAYIYIVASADYGDLSRPSYSSWPAYAYSGDLQGPFIWLPYLDRARVPVVRYP
ncbi:hypothetical protein M9H77_25323 [Catharanthus roseus]|uniref:Uncharacterized protein n=1 Tax=Catharanthus roseus TaxID=4058 RepID=A0ACC0A6L4_CATRO|nr:hypothetical protein M9H77_25323 [Catharanthus roseus]